MVLRDRQRLLLLAFLAVTTFADGVFAAGTQMFSTVPASTGEKPQSKIWYHDGAYWAIVQGPDGVAFYEKTGSNWTRGPFVDAILASSGQADVKWNGTNLFVLNYTSTCKLYKYAYESGTRSWNLLTGFPVTVPNPSGSETMSLEQDSTGRLWATAEGNGDINVYYSTSADHRTWSSSPVVLQSGVNIDDISAIVAFGGNKVGVFWSDQNRDEFGFRIHNDGDSPTTWQSKEIADSGSGHADDHINLAFDSTGRVYAISKDDLNEMRVHRRNTNGSWTTRTNVNGGESTRGIIMVAEADAKVYILYTRWGINPETVEYRVADISTLTFGGQTTFISSSAHMNNASGMKQLLPAGSLIAIAENLTHCWFNSIGSPPGGGGGGPQPPGPPENLTASLQYTPEQVSLGWSTPGSGTPDGYNVYRSIDGGTYTKLNGSLLTSRSYTDAGPPRSPICYQVRAVDNGLEGSASNAACVDNTPLAAPQAPVNVAAALLDAPPAAIALEFDEGSGQTASDASGNGNHARLGSSTGSDGADPTWVAGVAGGALQFDGSNDYIEVADSPSLDMPNGFTVEAWVRHNSGTGTVVNKGGSGERTYRVLVNSARDIEFRWETTSGSSRELIADNAISNSGWHHIACVYDMTASQNRIYVDGALVASGSASGVPASNSKVMSIGARFSSSYKDFLNGAVDQFRITPEALYAANFTPVSRSGDPANPKRAPRQVQSERVVLQWQAPPSGVAAASYNVYRAADGGGFVKLNTTPVASTSYSDTGIFVGTLCYQVTAINVQGLEGTPSATVCVVVLPPPPSAPQNSQANLVATPGGPPPGVTAYHFEESTGQMFADATGKNHLGQRGSSPVFDFLDPLWSAGFQGGGLYFDGANDRAVVADTTDLQLASSLTLEAWISAPDSGRVYTILAKGTANALNYALQIDAERRVRLRWQSAGGLDHGATSPSPLPDRSWHHVAGVYDQTAGENRVYVDGALAIAVPDSGAPLIGTHALDLGARRVGTGFTDHFLGYMDLVRISAGAVYGTSFTPPISYDPPPTMHVELSWQQPSSGPPAGYHVYRQVAGGILEPLTTLPIPTLSFDDLTPPPGTLCYRVAAMDSLGREGEASEIACVQNTITDSSDDDAPATVLGTAMLRVAPNPIGPRTTVSLHMPHARHVRLAVYNPRGQRVAILWNAPLALGMHRFNWNGRTDSGARAAAGAYWMVLDAGPDRARQKVILLH